MTMLEQQDDAVLSISLGHGFPWGDVADMGTRMLVVTDNDPEMGRTLGQALAAEFYAMRDIVQPTYLSMDEALDAALAEPSGPVVLADVSDNAGGGAPNDSTFLLRRMIERGIGNAAIGCIWDPIAVATAIELGEGVELPMRIGGKMGPMSGDPVDLQRAHRQDRARRYPALRRRHKPAGRFGGASCRQRSRHRRHQPA